MAKTYNLSEQVYDALSLIFRNTTLEPVPVVSGNVQGYNHPKRGAMVLMSPDDRTATILNTRTSLGKQLIRIVNGLILKVEGKKA